MGCYLRDQLVSDHTVSLNYGHICAFCVTSSLCKGWLQRANVHHVVPDSAIDQSLSRAVKWALLDWLVTDSGSAHCTFEPLDVKASQAKRQRPSCSPLFSNVPRRTEGIFVVSGGRAYGLITIPGHYDLHYNGRVRLRQVCVQYTSSAYCKQGSVLVRSHSSEVMMFIWAN